MHTPLVRDLDDPASLAEERALSTRAKAGDHRSFRALYDLFAAPLLNFLVSKLRNLDMAKDVLAETFRVAWETLHTFDPAGRSIWFWLHTIAHNRAKNAKRDAARAGRLFTGCDNMVEPAHVDDIAGRIDLPKLQRLVSATIAKMANENYRKVLTLELVEQLPREQSAEAMGMKVGTFNTTLFRAHLEFRKLWKEAA